MRLDYTNLVRRREKIPTALAINSKSVLRVKIRPHLNGKIFLLRKEYRIKKRVEMAVHRKLINLVYCIHIINMDIYHLHGFLICWF